MRSTYIHSITPSRPAHTFHNAKPPSPYITYRPVFMHFPPFTRFLKTRIASSLKKNLIFTNKMLYVMYVACWALSSFQNAKTIHYTPITLEGEFTTILKICLNLLIKSPRVILKNLHFLQILNLLSITLNSSKTIIITGVFACRLSIFFVDSIHSLNFHVRFLSISYIT